MTLMLFNDILHAFTTFKCKCLLDIMLSFNGI